MTRNFEKTDTHCYKNYRAQDKLNNTLRIVSPVQKCVIKMGKIFLIFLTMGISFFRMSKHAVFSGHPV